MQGPSVAEKCLALTEMGKGIMHRVYLMKSKLSSEKRDLYLGGGKLRLLRGALVKNFPHVPKMNKLSETFPGGKSFVSNASNTCRVLSSFRDLIYDTLDFALESANLLVSMPEHDMVHVDFTRNKGLCTIYMELLTTYIRVILFFSSMKVEAKAMYALYIAACSVLKETGKAYGAHEMTDGTFSAYQENAVILFEFLEGPQRHFIDRFNSCKDTIKEIIMEMRTPLLICDDLDSLTSEGVLDLRNPNMQPGPVEMAFDQTYGKSSSGWKNKPGTMYPGSISTTCSDRVKLSDHHNLALGIYEEMADSIAYKDFVIYGVIGCPELLLDADVLSIIKFCIDDILCINIFRDFNLSVHPFLENLAAEYPNKTLDPTVVVPKGVKIKTTLKSIAKTAITISHEKHALRRSILTNILESTLKILREMPGLLGPKLPQIIAIASLAKEELNIYFRHLGKLKIRADCRKYYDRNTYTAVDIGTLLAPLVQLSNLIREFRVIIVNYYSEYLAGSYLKSIFHALTPVSVFHPKITSIVNSLTSDLVLSTAVVGNEANTNSNVKERRSVAKPSFMLYGDSMSESKAPSRGSTTNVAQIRMDYRDRNFDEKLYRHALKRRQSVEESNGVSKHKHGIPVYDETSFKTASDIPIVTGEVFTLRTFRLNCLVLETYLASTEAYTELNGLSGSDSENLVANMERIRKLLQVLNASSRNSQFIDDLPSILEKHFEPLEVWWHRDLFIGSFYDSLEYSPDEMRTKYDADGYFTEEEVNRNGEDVGSSILYEPLSSMSFMYINSYALRSLHVDCPGEAELLISSALHNTDLMIDDMGTQVINSFNDYWHILQALELQTHQMEAANRAHRMVLARDQGKAIPVEPNPGFESSAFQKESIQQLTKYRNNLNNLILSANYFCCNVSTGCGAYSEGELTAVPISTGFILHDKEYDIPTYLQQRICLYLQDQICSGALFFSGIESRLSHVHIKPIKASLEYLICGLRALQDIMKSNGFAQTLYPVVVSRKEISPLSDIVSNLQTSGLSEKEVAAARAQAVYAATHTNHVQQQQLAELENNAKSDFDFASWLRILIFSEVCDVLFVPPPGKLLHGDIVASNKTLVWKYAHWFVGLIESVSHGKSGVIWFPTQNALGTIETVTIQPSEKSDSSFDTSNESKKSDDDASEEGANEVTEMYLKVLLDNNELRSLCSMIGIQGIRCIDSAIYGCIIPLINNQVRDFLQRNETALKKLTEDSSSEDSICDAQQKLKGLHPFMDAMLTIGFALTLRKAIYGAQRENMTDQFPGVLTALDAVCQGIDAFSTPRANSSAVFDLASCAGCLSAEGIDVALLAVLENECFQRRDKKATLKKARAAAEARAAEHSRRASVASKRMSMASLRESLKHSSLAHVAASDKNSVDDNDNPRSPADSFNHFAPTERDLEEMEAATETRRMDKEHYRKTCELFNLLPAACACLHLCDLWEYTEYHYKFNAYTNNEHCINLAVNTLLLSFFGRERSTAKADKSNSRKPRTGGASDTADKEKNAAWLRDNAREQSQKYVDITAQVLLHMQEVSFAQAKVLVDFEEDPVQSKVSKALLFRNNITYDDLTFSGHFESNYTLRPLNSMLITLDEYAKGCPLLDHMQCLENKITYSLIHHAATDCALGKTCAIDERERFHSQQS